MTKNCVAHWVAFSTESGDEVVVNLNNALYFKDDSKKGGCWIQLPLPGPPLFVRSRAHEIVQAIQDREDNFRDQ